MQIPKTLLSILASACVLTLLACGSDSSSSASRESDSSSSESVSSSSEASVASFDKALLQRNMDLGTSSGVRLWLSTGDGDLYSLWFLDTASSETSYGTVVVHADVSSGTLVFDSTSGYVYASNLQQGNAVLSRIEKGIRLEFSAEDSVLSVSIDGETPIEVKKATRAVDPDYLSNAKDLVEKKLEWSDGDSSSTYYFYKGGEYVRVARNDSADVFEAGYYDVHRQRLLLLPAYHSGTVSILSSYSAKLNGGNYVISDQTSQKEFGVSSISADYPSEETLSASAWSAKSNDTLKWTLSFDGESYTAAARTGLGNETLKFRRSGDWSVFGDYLVLGIAKCEANESVVCAPVVRGQVSHLTETSFEFDNFDKESKYALPEEWTVVVEE